MAWKRHANPFAGVSQEPMRFLHSISNMELASCVPIVRITKIDNKGRPDTSTRPLMYDLVQTPQFGVSEFGSDRFQERGKVSLNSLRVEYTQQYGPTLFRDVTLEFTVHNPSLVFDRAENIPWRQIIQRGGLFSLEYGWSADPSVVKNPLFNGMGMVTRDGLVIRATQTILLNVNWCSYRLKASGEVDVTVKALENGDIGLRQSRIADVSTNVRGLEAVRRTETLAERAGKDAEKAAKRVDDASSAAVLNSLLDGLPIINERGRKPYVLLGDVLDRMVDPLVRKAVQNFGYLGFGSNPPVDLLLGDFNYKAGRQSDPYGGKAMAGQDVGLFQLPLDVLRDSIAHFFALGRVFYLYDFIVTLIDLVNAEKAWAQPGPADDILKPELIMKTDTLGNGDGTSRLVMVVYDRMTITHAADRISRLPLDQQTHDAVMRRLSDANIPVLEFGRAGSLIIDASFEVQPDSLLQAIQIDGAMADQKDRVQQTQMPDLDSRLGQARNGDLVVPVSILQGEVTMQGNFANDVFTLLWLEYFGASEISGFFHINGKTDEIAPGKFTSAFKFISEGIDPLNTRKRLTEQELDAQQASELEMKQRAAKAATKKK